MSEVKAKEFAPQKFSLEVGGTEYILELSNEAIKKADEMAFIGKMSRGDMGTQESLQTLIYIFTMKNHFGMTANLAKKIATKIIEEQEYDTTELLTVLIEELALRYSQVFSASGTKKSLQKL